MMRTLALALLALSMAQPASADVLCPRITSEHNADVTDLGRFRQFHRWSDKTGGALAVAMWQYAPNLTSASNDFDDGFRSVSNLHPGDGGLELTASGDAKAVFEMFTPWIIVPKVHLLDDDADDSEASIVTFDAIRPVSVRISLDHGKTWRGVTTVRGKASIDLTSQVKGTYGYLLELRAEGRANDLVLRALSVETWVQVAPISLPRLKSGVNECRYEIGDRYGKRTVPMFVQPNVADPDDLKKHVLELPEDYDLERRTARIRGDVILKLEAPSGTMIDWFTAGACFTTHQGRGAKGTDNRIAFAVDQPEGFTEVYKAEVPTWVNHWRYQWDEDIRLEKPARVAFVKYTGNPAVNVLRATVHLVPRRPPQEAIRITHGYELAGELVEQLVELKTTGDYTVEVAGEPENVFVRMAVPSGVR